jgi:hypothetical protein
MILPQYGITIATAGNGRLWPWQVHSFLLNEMASSGGLEPPQLTLSPQLERISRTFLEHYHAPSRASYESLFSGYFQVAIPYEVQLGWVEGDTKRWGACRLGKSHTVTHEGQAQVIFDCDGGDVRFDVQLDARGERIVSYSWMGVPEEPESCVMPWN